ncbi:MAG: DUF6359 domain-containing protein [Clostridium sp.]|nr:DUF6359 domain-containing protein [Clostridium sp.]
MISIKQIIAGSVLALTLGFTACQNSFDDPQMNVPVATLKPNTTILELKQQYWNNDANYIDTVGVTSAGEHVVIAGRVISSDETGNIYKSLVIQDETAALAISIDYSNLYVDYRVGQEIVLDVTDLYIGKYSSLQQLGYPDYSGSYGWQATFMPYEMFASHRQFNGLPEPEKIDTIVTTIAALPTSADGLQRMQSQLVRFNNVSFEGGGELAYCTGHKENTNRTLVDANGTTLTVRTSGYSRFWSEKLPAGYGDVIGILSYNGSGSSANWQLLIRSLDDVINFGNPTLEKGTDTNPYSVSDAVAIENTGSTTAGWVSGYIVGAVKAEITEVRSADDIEFTAPAEMNNTLVIGETADARTLDKLLVVSLAQGSAFRQYGNLRDNPDNLGRSIMVYGTLDRYMSTYGITGNQGTVNEFRIDGVEPAGSGVAAGDGTEASPYNPTQVVAMGTDASVADKWIKGYIVGWIYNKYNGADQNFADENNTFFTVPAQLNTNVLIATTPDVTDYRQCVAVNLPTGSIRSAINLVDNPGNLGKLVELHGAIRKYFSMAGFRDVTAYKLGDGGETPVTPPSGGGDPVTSLDVTFDGLSDISGLPGWTTVETSGNKAWFVNSYSGNYFAEVTGYKGTAGASGFESWLITPGLNVDEMSSKTFSFKSCVGYSGSGSLEVYAMTSSDPKTATLTKLNANIVQPSGSWSEFTESGEISLEQFSGVIYIGFLYKGAAADNYTTYRVDDIQAGVSGGSTPVTPPDEPGDEDAGTASNPYTVAQVLAINPPSTAVVEEGKWVTGYIVGYVDTSVKSSASDESVIFGVINGDKKTYTNVLIATSADETDWHKCVSVNLASGSNARKALNLGDNPTMLGQQISVKGNIRLYVGLPGVYGVTEYALGAKGN